jgi:protein translocase SecG subunit
MSLGALAPWLAVIEIILSVSIIVLVVLQSKGNDMSAFMGGSENSGFRTKRGMEAALHRVTIYFGIVFFVVTLLNFVAWGQFTS